MYSGVYSSAELGGRTARPGRRLRADRRWSRPGPAAPPRAVDLDVGTTSSGRATMSAHGPCAVVLSAALFTPTFGGMQHFQNALSLKKCSR